MSSDYRLKSEKAFNYVFKNGKKAFSSSLSLLYVPSEQLKVGFAVGKKHGGSVERNKIKRLLREAFRNFLPEINKSFYFVFIPKVREEYSYEKFKRDMDYILKKGGFKL